MKSTLVKLFGFPATLVHGDTLVLDRWVWLKDRLSRISDSYSKKLIDIGCGTGAFTIGSSLLGYDSLGLSWDERNQKVASERALLCNATKAKFEIQDVRNLHERIDLVNEFDVAK
jgi:ribosomal protein L11 methylase PrmA